MPPSKHEAARAVSAPPPVSFPPSSAARIKNALRKQVKIGVYPAHDQIIVAAAGEHGCNSDAEMYRKVIAVGLKSMGLLPSNAFGQNNGSASSKAA